jgi:hypothetical protein
MANDCLQLLQSAEDVFVILPEGEVRVAVMKIGRERGRRMLDLDWPDSDNDQSGTIVYEEGVRNATFDESTQIMSMTDAYRGLLKLKLVMS